MFMILLRNDRRNGTRLLLFILYTLNRTEYKLEATSIYTHILLTSLVWWILIPCLINMATTSKRPLAAAVISGVDPNCN